MSVTLVAKVMLGVEHEAVLQAKGLRVVAGVDEVGRGPLAGPVVAAAVVVPEDAEVRAWLLARAGDSKALTKLKREEVAAYVHGRCQVGIGEASVAEIDMLNIRQATLLAMRRAVEALPQRVEALLVDGLDMPLKMPGRAVVKGDAVELCISCASIVAKVMRDGLMVRLAEIHPAYGWASNAGYGAAVHLKALREIGVTEHHRKTFAPVRQLLEEQAEKAEKSVTNETCAPSLAA